jgi:hypothetical protein
LLEHRAFRLTLAVAFICLHFAAFAAMGASRFHLPLYGGGPKVVYSAPDLPLVGPAEPVGWQRLLVARWDSQHYVSWALRGVTLCPAEDMRKSDLSSRLVYCGFNFYPGYPALGALLARVSGLSVDLALLAWTLAGTVMLFYAWTSKFVQHALGAKATYLSLLLFNVFTTGFAVVTVQTEALTLGLMFIAMRCLSSKRFWLGALAAGAASALRVTGASIGGGFWVAVAYSMFQERRSLLHALGTLIPLAPIAIFGQLAIFAFYGLRYHDPLLYVHAHSHAYAHAPSILTLLAPAPERVLGSIQGGLHEGVFLAFGFLFLALGHRDALRRFQPTVQIFLYVSAFLWLSVSMLGTADLSFAGMNRYWLGIPLLFFSMATVLRRRPIAALVWITISLWHYWNVDLCVYLAEHDAAGMCLLGHQP